MGIYILPYIGQSDREIKELTRTHESILITLDSGTSFRTQFLAKYKPSNHELILTKRYHNIRFKLIEGLEAPDIKFLYEHKYKISDKPSVRTIIRTILEGNPKKGISPIMDERLIPSILKLIDPNLKSEAAIKFLADNYPLDHDRLRMSYMCLCREFRLYFNHLPDFYNKYESIDI